MTTIKFNSPLFGVSGRLGSVVTYELNGVQVIRSLPYNKKRKLTLLQQAQRKSFKIQYRIAKSLKLQIIQRVWDRFSCQGGMNGYTALFKSTGQPMGNQEKLSFPN